MYLCNKGIHINIVSEYLSASKIDSFRRLETGYNNSIVARLDD